MSLRSHPRFAILASLVGGAAGTAVILHRFGMGTFGFPGRWWVALLIGLMISAGAALWLHRAARRRARLAAIRSLLPRYPNGRHAWAAAAGGGRGAIGHFLLDDFELPEEPSERIPAGRAEIRAATRALLVSLEEELRGETGWKRRNGRPACRRARLRAAGRPQAKRRRMPPRMAAIPS